MPLFSGLFAYAIAPKVLLLKKYLPGFLLSLQEASRLRILRHCLLCISHRKPLYSGHPVRILLRFPESCAVRPFPSESTGDAAGSSATTFTSGFWDFRYSPTPVSVPPVPTPAIKISTFPSVSFQISGPVVSLCF